MTDLWHRHETIELELTLTVDNEARSLAGIEALELQLKAAPGTADPPLVSIGLGTGITLRDQDEDVGMADAVIPYTAWASVPAGTYYWEVVGVWPGTPAIRRYLQPPRKVILSDVVNPP